MRSSQLRAEEADRPRLKEAVATPRRRAVSLRLEVLGEFARFGVVERDEMRTARNERRIL